MTSTGGLLSGWRAIVRSTWRAYLVLGGFGVVAITAQAVSGEYNRLEWREIAFDVAVVMGLTFFASFFTALVFHYQVRRNTRWPGGGGKRGRS